LFFNRPPAELVLLVGETATRLPQLQAASGARYGAADQQFWIKGDRAVWTLGRAPAMACEVQAPVGAAPSTGSPPGSPAASPR
jgi:membrane-bound inhibitor of C-type lysozyme